jgi:O-acetyl-ADP-ribose deacetylase (regulator of RNase III)
VSIEVIEDGDIFTSGAEILVCPTNALGVFGAGLAKAFWESHRWGVACRRYAKDCKAGLVAEGSVVCYPGQGEFTVAFAATKGDWRKPSRRMKVADCAQGLVDLVHLMRPASIAIPALGAGLGGLPWVDVERVIRREFDSSRSSTRAMVFAPKEKKP